MEKTYNIGKKWRVVFSYTIWMFEYYVRRTRNELMLDDVDVMLLTGLKNIYTKKPNSVKLNEDQMKFFKVMVDYVNWKLINELELPFDKNEMLYFKQSQKFMEHFKTSNDIYDEWKQSRLELVELFKY